MFWGQYSAVVYTSFGFSSTLTDRHDDSDKHAHENHTEQSCLIYGDATVEEGVPCTCRVRQHHTETKAYAASFKATDMVGVVSPPGAINDRETTSAKQALEI